MKLRGKPFSSLALCSEDRRVIGVTMDRLPDQAFPCRECRMKFAAIRKLCRFHRGRRKPRRFDMLLCLGFWRLARLRTRLPLLDLRAHNARARVRKDGRLGLAPIALRVTPSH